MFKKDKILSCFDSGLKLYNNTTRNIMKKNFFICFLLLIVNFSSLFAESKKNTYDEKIIYAMLMNQLQYSLQTIEYYGDRLVLDQEYNTIICKIDKTKLKDENEEAITSFTNLLGTITKLRLNDNEKIFLEQQASKEKKEAINKVLQGTALSSIYGIQQLGSGIAKLKDVKSSSEGITQIIQGSSGLLYSGVSAFFNYRNAINSVQNQLNKDLFKIEQENLKTIDAYRNSLFKTQAKFITRYDIPKRYEIKEDQMKDLIEILDSKKYDNKSKLVLLEEKKDIFSIFTPFWYELGAAYQAEGNYQKAIECYTEFENQKKKYSIIDNDSYYTELSKNMITMIQTGKTKADIAQYIKIIENDETVSTEVENKLYLASIYESLGQSDNALEKLESVINKNKKFVATARDYHEYIRMSSSDKAQKTFLLAQLEIASKEEIDNSLSKITDNKNKEYINNKKLVFYLPIAIGDSFTLDVVVDNVYYDSEKIIIGDKCYYYVNLNRDDLFKKNDNLSVVMLDKNRNDYVLNYGLNYYSPADMKCIDNSFTMLKEGKEHINLDYSDLEQININLYLLKIKEATNQKDFKSKLPEKKAEILKSCYEDAMRAYLSTPYVYKEKLLLINKRVLSYGLKTLETRNNLYSFDKYGDFIDETSVVAIPKSVNEIYSLAMQGDSKALYEYGMLFFIGNEVTKNYLTAVKWLKMAANKNNGDAYYQLGMCFDQGLGVIKDKKRANKYYEQARKLGNVMAQTILSGGSKKFIFFESNITYDDDNSLISSKEFNVTGQCKKNLFMNIQVTPRGDEKLNSKSSIPAKIIVSTSNSDLFINSVALVAFKDMKNTYENGNNVFIFSIDPSIINGGKVRFKLYSEKPCVANFKLIFEDTKEISIGIPQEIDWKVQFN